jgi:acetyltransferase
VHAIRRLFKRLSPEEIRMRFQYARNELPEWEARRLCTLDPECEAAFVLMDPSVDPQEMRGVGRIYADAATRTAEFAVLVEHNWTGRGLGAFLMHQLVAECRRRGLHKLFGQVLVENRPMLDLCRDLGFQRHLMHEEPGTSILTLQLD